MLTVSWARETNYLAGPCDGLGIHIILGSRFHWEIRPTRGAGVDLARAPDLAPWGGVGLLPVGQPSCHTGDGEQDREEVGGEAHGLVDQPGVEIHVGIKPALDKVAVLAGSVLQSHRDIDKGLASTYFKDLALDTASHFLTS